MSFRLTEDIEKNKSELIFLDLSETVILTKEELEKTISKIPNLKLKSDPIEEALNQKTIGDSLKINSCLSNTSKFVSKNSNQKKITRNQSLLVSVVRSEKPLVYSFGNPIPESMKSINLNDFCETDIDWKMLTILRPNNKLEDQYFSKLVELYRLRHKTRIEDGFGLKEAVFKKSRHPRVMRYKPISFARIDSFGFESNRNSFKFKEDISYEAFARVLIETQTNRSNDENIISSEDILALEESLDLK